MVILLRCSFTISDVPAARLSSFTICIMVSCCTNWATACACLSVKSPLVGLVRLGYQLVSHKTFMPPKVINENNLPDSFRCLLQLQSLLRMLFYKIANQVADQLAGKFVLPAIGQLRGAFANMQVSHFGILCGKSDILPGM
jgi:hypothetical protein